MTYLERLKRDVPTKRGVRLTFSSGNTEKTIKVSREAAGQILQALQIPTKKGTAGVQLTRTVLGHQIVQTPRPRGCSCAPRSGELSYSLCLRGFSRN